MQPVTMQALRRIGVALAALAAGFAAAGAHAQPEELGHGITLYGGARFGGSFADKDTEARVRLRDAAAGSIALDFAVDSARQVQLFASRQNSQLPLRTGGSLPLHLTMLHIGGTNFFDEPGGAIGRGPYAVGGLGVTRMDPGLDGFSSETRPSLNVGFGWMLPLGTRIALRLEARGYWTLINSSSTLFCSGGCTLQVKGDLIEQGEVMLGVTARF